jgi:hypothetical protein
VPLASAALASTASEPSGAACPACPYCATALPAAAIVCAACGRDLFLFRPLLDHSHALERQLADASRRLSVVEARLAEIGDTAATAHQVAHQAASGRVQRRPVPPLVSVTASLIIVLMSVHAFIVLMLDLPVLWLRLACVALPIPVGYWLSSSRKRPTYRLLLVTVSVALLAPLGMAAVVALVDHASLLPSDLREYQEFMSFALSIGLAMGTGLILGRMLGPTPAERKSARATDGSIAGLASGAFKRWLFKLTPEAAQKNFEGLQKALLALVALCTTAASMVSGLKDVVASGRPRSVQQQTLQQQQPPQQQPPQTQPPAQANSVGPVLVPLLPPAPAPTPAPARSAMPGDIRPAHEHRAGNGAAAAAAATTSPPTIRLDDLIGAEPAAAGASR